MLSTDLAKSLREMAATFPLNDEEQRRLRQAADALMLLDRAQASLERMGSLGDEMAAKLKAIEALARELEAKRRVLGRRKKGTPIGVDAHISERSRLAQHAGVYQEVYERLSAILEGK